MRSRTVAGWATISLAASFALSSTPVAMAQPVVTAELPVDECKISAQVADLFNEGFDRGVLAASPTGTLTAQVVFVEFPDLALGAPGNATLDDVRQGIADTEARLEGLSEGRLDVVVLEHPDPIMLTKPTTEYPATQKQDFDPRTWASFVADAITAAAGSIDFAASDVVWLFFPSAPQLPTRAQADNLVLLPGGNSPVDRAVTLPMVQQDLRATLVHETGHTFGLPDLYATSGDLPSGLYVSGWDLMGLAAGGEFFSWHRWRLGWMDDSHVRCIAPGGGGPDLKIDALTRDGPVLAAVIPTSDRRVLVVESRRADRYNGPFFSGGVFVYIVSSDVKSGEGPVRIAPKDGTEPPQFGPDFDEAPLAVGERYTDVESSTTITVVASSEWSDTVRIASTADATPPPTEPGTPANPAEPADVPARDSASTLPPTGSDSSPVLALSTGLLVTGVLVMALGRRRRSQPPVTRR